jgi:putative ATP-binding cassette transporter
VRVNQAFFTVHDSSVSVEGYGLAPLHLIIVGGNGSGKSTLLKLLTGRYHPAMGEIMVDSNCVDKSNLEMHREMFSILFLDFHLFDRFYGFKDVD